MKKTFGKTLWVVPVFCVAAGWFCFQLEFRVFGRLAIVTLPDGTITVDNRRWLVISAARFALTLAVGGLLVFRRMTRKEVMRSACVMFVFSAVWGLTVQFTQISWLSIGYSEVHTWCDVVSQVLLRWNVDQWVSAVLLWAAPFLFVPFGKKKPESSGDSALQADI